MLHRAVLFIKNRLFPPHTKYMTKGYNNQWKKAHSKMIFQNNSGLQMIKVEEYGFFFPLPNQQCCNSSSK